MSHYFIPDDTLASKIKTFQYTFKGAAFTFVSDSGLFSMGHVDYASDILMREMPALEGRLLDLGCGYGPIGIVLGKTYGLDVTFADVNERALQYTEENCKRNGFSGAIVASDCFNGIEGQFDSVVLNPPIHAGKQKIFEMYAGAYAHLVLGGKFFIVIQKKHGANSSIVELERLFGEAQVSTLYKKKGFFVLQCTRSA